METGADDASACEPQVGPLMRRGPPFRHRSWNSAARLAHAGRGRSRRTSRGTWSGLLVLLLILGLMALFAVLKGWGPWREAPAPPPDTGAATQQTVTHRRIQIVDGDSLRAGHENIRLIDIDAPELSQLCADAAGRDWTCGRAAKERLRALIGGRPVACTARGQDRYGRTLAVCGAGPIADLGAELVRNGYAVNYARDGDGYAAAESEARDARRGIWQGSFERPQDWRRRNPRHPRRSNTFQ